MKQKGNAKRVPNRNYWGKYENQVSNELKTMVHEQYLSYDTLYVYCDSSLSQVLKQMSIACSYVGTGRVIVKQQYVYPPNDSTDKAIYGEIKAVIFGLTHFEKYKMPNCEKVIFYSDVYDIEDFLHNKITFKKNASLKKLQSEFIMLYQKVQMENPNLTIEVKYLKLEEKINNPFHRSSHNAANGMLNKNVK